jgi:hypothetical protein
MIAIIFLYLLTVAALWWITQPVEGFAYRKNPCGEFKTCSSCADAAACGWCSDLKVCQPMAQDGFPIRTKDSSTEDDVMDSPYLEERRSKEDILKTAKASRIHICNPFGYITDSDKCS